MSPSFIISSSLLIAILCHPPFIIFSQATDTLIPGQSLRDGEFLISAGNAFELGFFSPSNSQNRYVGIWYHNFSANTIFWVANRNSPVGDKSGSLTFSADGNLIIVNGAKDTLWSSNASISPSSKSVVKLLDSGNLQFNASANIISWQSFDYPTDVFLPGMKIGLDLVTKKNQLSMSWKSIQDPAVGNYSFGMDPGGSTQIFVWEGTKPRWRSGRWNGQVFTGVKYPTQLYVDALHISDYENEGKMNFYFRYVEVSENEGKMYFYFQYVDVSHRFVITWDGILEHIAWNQDTKVWYRISAQPVTECDLYNNCGNGGICTDDSMPKCSCLPGFVPKSIDEWGNGNWTSGCIRRMALQCDRNVSSSAEEAESDGYLKLENVKVPDSSVLHQDVVNITECERTCRERCSCKAYSYVAGIGCLVWDADLVDIHDMSNAGNDLYLRLAASELKNMKKKKNAAVIVTLVVVSATIVLVGCSYLLWKKRKRVRAMIKLQKHRSARRVEEGSSDYLSKGDEMQDMQEGKSREAHLYSFTAILDATDNFSSLNLLGKGGFGPVYKGIFPHGQHIAVKRLSRSSGQGQEEFKNEVILISKLQHRNLVRLLGCCIQGEEKLLIYEYMPNRSLDAFLFDKAKKGSLDWKRRYNIIEGIARGLLYLHRDSRLRVIHRDLKVSNILLDEEMNPKISDFGMARIFGQDDCETDTKHVVGTYGYMSPEYAVRGVFSVKSDVYSFGVILLEIISGEKNSSYENPEFSLGLLPYAWKLWNEDNMMEFVDPFIRNSCTISEIARCMNVALLCIQDRASDRPTMPLVVTMMESGIADLTLPIRPTFMTEITPAETDTSTRDHEHSATASITTLTGR